ncbi:hypothetical protein H9L05_14070 [Hymenobacter qilianensis]|uniref:Uncharacterized protein n=1 Tax=Hymenobacter qilianensis TaxID=1385715 RepID=A0A7H0GSE1_9BACT|nr:hypothetical protein [Hymenobacter qilianensis]QNP51207.1 hypothetical protein H9L05_14070 [Hymenobacter qilianensis]
MKTLLSVFSCCLLLALTSCGSDSQTATSVATPPVAADKKPPRHAPAPFCSSVIASQRA